MGNAHDQPKRNKSLDLVVTRAASSHTKLAITGRYHRLPKRLEDDYIVHPKVLGSGYNGQVIMAESKQSKNLFAIKEYNLIGITSDKREEMEAELEIFLALDHPHVARLSDVYESRNKLSLVMELCRGGELFKRVHKKRRFNERDACEAAWQMLLALNYIHEHRVVHRDIKLENFLYEKEDTDYLKLIDFGFSKLLRGTNTRMALSCGTLAYVAPEVLEQDYTSQCDMWSFGVTIFVVLFGYMPFQGDEAAMFKAIKSGKYKVSPEIWKRVSADAKDFVEKLLVVNPKQRLTAEQALKHPWIAERNKLAGGDEVTSNIADALASYGQASAFRKACMSMMAWSLTVEERTEVREAFIQLDPERHGCIQLHEFKQVMMEKFHVTDEEAAQTFHSIDVNHDDEIHYTEFLAAMVSTRIALHDDLLQQAFRRFDADNSGYITLENLHEVLGESFEDVEVHKLIEEADVHKDGKISYHEFLKYLHDHNTNEDHATAGGRLVDKLHKENGEARRTLHKRKKESGDNGGAAEDKNNKTEQDKTETKCQCDIL